MWRDDKLVSLTPKQFDLLFYFVENAGCVTKKSELLNAVWTDAYIEEATLARNVSWLRKKLSDCRDDKPLIETVPKLGYRFMAEVTRPADDEHALIIEEQTVQHIQGEETIEFDDKAIEETAEQENGNEERVHTALSPQNHTSRRHYISTVTLLLIVITCFTLVASGYVLFRNSLKTDEQITGLQVKTTITVKNITVDASQQTVDTGLIIQPGDTIKVSAMGILQFETGQTWTFQGNKKAIVSADYTFPNADPGSLVAWIGTETDKTNYFQVSKNHTVTADIGGSLYVAINDRKSQYANNRGGLAVAVVLFRTYSIYAEDNDFEAAWGSGLVMLYREDTLAIRGRGDVSYWPGGELYDLNGSDHDTYGHLAPEIHARSLIGKIGGRTPFKVGMDYPPQTMKVNGMLFLSVNDSINKPGAFKNNSGSISIDVEVGRAPEAFKNPIQNGLPNQ